MKVGIIGKGKMGLDLFNVLLEYDHSIVLICRTEEDIELINSKTEKLFRKKLKRGFITENEFSHKLQMYKISTDYADLRDCDIVFESIVENLQLKQTVMNKVEAAVRKDCIITTNTSSLDVNQVFETVGNKSRCMGVHFFYPIKIITTVEINRPEAVEEKYVICASEFLKQIGRNILMLSQEGNLILSKILTTIVSCAYLIYEEGLLSIKQINSFTKEQVMMFGTFEIVDSTGFLIIMECLSNFSTKRYEKIYKSLYDAAFDLLGKEGFLAAEANGILENRVVPDEELIRRKENGVLKLKAVILNELAYIYNQGIVKDPYFLDAVKETLGFMKHPKDLFHEIGENIIVNMLSQEYEKEQLGFFLPENYDLYKE